MQSQTEATESQVGEMILIRKSPSPEALLALKREAEEKGLSDQEGYAMLRNPLKGQVREALMAEQGHLCAYCMRRIPDDRILAEDVDLSDVYIEHWQARSSDQNGLDNKGLDYNNMLAVCSGNEKAPGATGRRKKKHFTCDKKRENRPLTVNPLDQRTLDSIYYSDNGTMKSYDAGINDDINVKLNLNCKEDAVSLPQSRKAVLDAVQADIYSQDGDMLQNCIDQLQLWENETDPKTPYIGIAISWLKGMIRTLGQNSEKQEETSQ
jgi:uncharacterized protein (TIGR02646 family)